MKIDRVELLQIIKDSIPTIDLSKITLDTPLMDTGMDSLDQATMLLAIQERYDVKIVDEEVDELSSVNAIAELLESQ